MSEMGFMLFQHIASGVETVLCAFCMAVFFRPYMAGRKNRLQKTIAVFLAYGTVYVAGEALSISGWLCMVIVLFLLMAGSRWLCLERKQAFLYGILFFCTRDMGRLITESLYYLFNGKIVQGLDNENMISGWRRTGIPQISGNTLCTVARFSRWRTHWRKRRSWHMGLPTAAHCKNCGKWA